MTTQSSDWYEMLQLRNLLGIATENLAREENLSLVLIPTMSKDMDEQLKLALKLVDVFDRANEKTYVTLLLYSVDKPESSYAQVRLYARKKEDENIQQFVYVKYKFEEIIHLLDVILLYMISCCYKTKL